MERIRISADHCTKVKFVRSNCQRCLSVCPAHAIEFGDGTLKITSRCTGCECCVAACPNEVFSLATEGERGSDPGQDLNSIYCSKLVPGKIDLSKPLAGGIVPCIGSLPLHFLLSWATSAKGAIKIITADCAQCELRAGFFNFEKAKKEILSPLLSLKVPMIAILHQRGTEQDKREAGKRYLAWKARQEEKSGLRRRDFLLNLRRPASLRERAKNPGEIEKKDSKASEKRLPMWVNTLITLFRNNSGCFPEGERVPFFSDIEINEPCTGCEVCASFCPTGALRGKTTGGRFLLEWTPSHCTGCHLCEEICPEHSLHLFPGLPVQNIYDETTSIIKSLYHYQCSECRREYRSPDLRVPCPYCQKQTELIQDYTRALYGEKEKRFFENE